MKRGIFLNKKIFVFLLLVNVLFFVIWNDILVTLYTMLVLSIQYFCSKLFDKYKIRRLKRIRSLSKDELVNLLNYENGKNYDFNGLNKLLPLVILIFFTFIMAIFQMSDIYIYTEIVVLLYFLMLFSNDKIKEESYIKRVLRLNNIVLDESTKLEYIYMLKKEI
ncbi:hypothetical protein D3C71_1519540 [compost metagenome]